MVSIRKTLEPDSACFCWRSAELEKAEDGVKIAETPLKEMKLFYPHKCVRWGLPRFSLINGFSVKVQGKIGMGNFAV